MSKPNLFEVAALAHALIERDFFDTKHVPLIIWHDLGLLNAPTGRLCHAIDVVINQYLYDELTNV